MRKSFEEVAGEYLKFSRETFPDSIPQTCLYKLRDELDEVEIALKEDNIEHLAEEFADMLSCFLSAFDTAGLSIYDITHALEKKTLKNQGRVWKKNENGTYSHDKSDWDEQ